MIGPGDTAVSLKCHDPAGTAIEISNEEILNHTLILGATGSGKTSRVVLPAFDDLCRGLNGLLVFDGKGDSSFRDAIRESTRRHGRELLEVDGDGLVGFDIFEPMRVKGVLGVDAVTETLCCALPVDVRNRYWDIVFKKIARNALLILQLTNPEFEYVEAIDWLECYLVSYSKRDDAVASRIETLRDMKCKAKIGAENVDQALRGHEMWDWLDGRTRSNHQSMATTVLDALRSPLAKKYFAAEACVQIEDTLEKGAVLLVRVDGFGAKPFARLLGNCVKGTFFRALMEREEPKTNWGLISDDWSLSVSGGLESAASEAAALPLIRSKRGFVLAGCQSLAAIDLLVGRQERESAVANFGTLLFMRGRDYAIDALAFRTFFDPKLENHESLCVRNNEGEVVSRTSVVRRNGGSHAPMGTLCRMATGEALVAVCDRVYEQSMLLAPYGEIREQWGF